MLSHNLKSLIFKGIYIPEPSSLNKLVLYGNPVFHKKNFWITSKLKLFVMICFICINITHVFATVSLGNSDILINSDKLIVNKENSSAIFKGSVIVTFEDIKIKTTIITIYYKQTDKKRSTIDKIIFPEKITAIKNCGEGVLIANEGEYLVGENKLILRGNVQIKDKDSILKTDQMIYLTNLKSVTEEKNNAK